MLDAAAMARSTRHTPAGVRLVLTPLLAVLGVLFALLSHGAALASASLPAGEPAGWARESAWPRAIEAAPAGPYLTRGKTSAPAALAGTIARLRDGDARLADAEPGNRGESLDERWLGSPPETARSERRERGDVPSWGCVPASFYGISRTSGGAEGAPSPAVRARRERAPHESLDWHVHAPRGPPSKLSA